MDNKLFNYHWCTVQTWRLIQITFKTFGSYRTENTKRLKKPLDLIQSGTMYVVRTVFIVRITETRKYTVRVESLQGLIGDLPKFLTVAQCLRCCATNRKVAGSIPAGVNEFFIDIKSFRSHYGPGIDSASNRNDYQEYLLGVKAAGA